MEVLLQSLEGIPGNSILSIRCGTTRRQAPVSAIDKPFRFPCKPEDCAAVKIDLFRHVATARTVTEAGTSEHKLMLEEVSNAGNQTFDSNLGVAFQMRPATKGAKHMGDGMIESTRKKETDSLMDKYLADHNVLSFLQGILQGLVKEQPENPYSFIAKQFVAEATEKEAFTIPEQTPPSVQDEVPEPTLQGEVLNCLLRGSENGELDRLLSQTEQEETAFTNTAADMESIRKFLDEAKSESAFLKQTLDEFQKELEKRMKENNELKSLLKEDKYFAQKDDAKDTSRNQDDLRQQTAQTFFNAASSTRLDDIFHNLREGTDVGIEVTVQQQARKIEALESKLEKAFETISLKERGMAELLGDMTQLEKKYNEEQMKAAEIIASKEKSMVELISDMAKLENKYNEEQRNSAEAIYELAALVESLQAPKPQEEVAPKELEDFRLEARDTFAKALQTGSLQEALPQTLPSEQQEEVAPKELEDFRLEARDTFAKALQTGSLQEASPQPPPSEQQEQESSKELEDLRLQARDTFAEALQTGSLQGALSQSQQSEQQEVESSKELEDLRLQARDTLAEALQTGSLHEALSQTQEKDSSKEEEDLRLQARGMFAEALRTGALQKALPLPPSSEQPEEMSSKEEEDLRLQARGMFAEALRTGALQEALPQAEEQSNEKMDMLRSKAMETLAKGARERRESLDSSTKTPIPNTMDTLRSRARETLSDAAKDGQLKEALKGVQGDANKVVSILRENSFAGYYKAYIGKAIGIAAWQDIYNRFGVPDRGFARAPKPPETQEAKNDIEELPKASAPQVEDLPYWVPSSERESSLQSDISVSPRVQLLIQVKDPRPTNAVESKSAEAQVAPTPPRAEDSESKVGVPMGPTPSREEASVLPFGDYYKKHVLPSIACSFPNREQAAPPAELPQLDLSNVQELHMQLEKLARDRAALLRQVNEVRGLVNEVAAENNKLAKEVLSRPLTPEGEEALLQNAEFLSTYGTSSSPP